MDRMLRYHSSSVSSCHICLARSSRPACSSSISRRSAPGRIIPDPASSPPTSTSLMTCRRSLRTHARRGALKEAFGRCTISWGSQLSAARLSATLPCRPEILSLPLIENAARATTGSTNGTRTSTEAAMLARSV